MPARGIIVLRPQCLRDETAATASKRQSCPVKNSAAQGCAATGSRSLLNTNLSTLGSLHHCSPHSHAFAQRAPALQANQLAHERISRRGCGHQLRPCKERVAHTPKQRSAAPAFSHDIQRAQQRILLHTVSCAVQPGVEHGVHHAVSKERGRTCREQALASRRARHNRPGTQARNQAAPAAGEFSSCKKRAAELGRAGPLLKRGERMAQQPARAQLKKERDAVLVEPSRLSLGGGVRDDELRVLIGGAASNTASSDLVLGGVCPRAKAGVKRSALAPARQLLAQASPTSRASSRVTPTEKHQALPALQESAACMCQQQTLAAAVGSVQMPGTSRATRQLQRRASPEVRGKQLVSPRGALLSGIAVLGGGAKLPARIQLHAPQLKGAHQ